MSTRPLPEVLKINPLRARLVDHPFFERVRNAPVSRQAAACYIGQWWHPLHYFPTFLAKSVAALPDINAKTAVTKILFQETGEGDPARAHEQIYIASMGRLGFSSHDTTGAPPTSETKALLAGYARASENWLSAIGYIVATEAADLTMVSGLGAALARATGVEDNEWVAIHVRQEPDHTDEADNTLLQAFSETERLDVIRAAEDMWRLWIAFFDRLDGEFAGLTGKAQVGAPEVQTV